MKVLHVAPYETGQPSLGGVLTYATGLAAAQQGAGRRVWVLCARLASPENAGPWERALVATDLHRFAYVPRYRRQLAEMQREFGLAAEGCQGQAHNRIAFEQIRQSRGKFWYGFDRDDLSVRVHTEAAQVNWPSLPSTSTIARGSRPGS